MESWGRGPYYIEGWGRGPYYMEGWGRGPYYRLVLCVVSWQVAMVECGIAEQLLGIVNQEQLKQALDIIVQLLKNGSYVGFIFFCHEGKTKGCGMCWDEVSAEVGYGEGERGVGREGVGVFSRSHQSRCRHVYAENV